MKREIDKIRESAKVFEVIDTEDPSPIILMVSTPEGLYTVRKNSIHMTRLADMIDPERANINLPDVHQKILSYGMDDRVVSVVLGTADVLLNGNFLNKFIPKDLAMSKIMALVLLLCDIQDQSNRVNKEIEGIVGKGIVSGGSKGQTIPHTPNLKNVVELIIRKADLVRETMIDFLVELYKPNDPLNEKGRLKRLRESVVSRHGENHIFVEYFNELESKFSFLAEFRNAWEHPRQGYQVILKDFDIYPNGDIHTPSVQLIHPKTPQDKIAVSVFSKQMLEALIIQCEIFLGNICSSNASFGAFKIAVAEVPQERRRYPDVRLGYEIFLNGEWQIIG